jgi:hypothetical protein
MKLIETLIVAGCSHSFGAETVSEDHPTHPSSIDNAFGKFLSDKIGCKYVNISFSGLSNFDICRRVQQELDFKEYNPETTLVIIGWTDPNRFTFYPNNGNIITNFIGNLFPTGSFPHNFSAYSIDYAFAFKHVRTALQHIREMKFSQDFLRFFRKFIFKTNYFYDLNYTLRLLTAKYLECKKIPYLTFSTLKEPPYKNTFKYEKLLSNKNNILENKDKFNYYDAFAKYGVYKGGHLNINAHKACAKYLYLELIDRQII